MTPLPRYRTLRLLALTGSAWAALVVAVAYALNSWGRDIAAADENNLAEWLTEARVYRKTLPGSAREYLARLADPSAGDAAVKRDELREQLRCLGEPTRVYENRLPMFPKIYRLELTCAPAAGPAESVAWDSQLPRPRGENGRGVRSLDLTVADTAHGSASVRCDYELHVYSPQRDEAERHLLISVVVFAAAGLATLLALVAGYQVVRRELGDRDTLHAAELRARDAEREAAEARSQVYAGIGVMAGSYAHNIKNLLVRPNDLLERCLEQSGLPDEQARRLGEVRDTLGTVTDRLRMILQTVRRDPGTSERSRLDLRGVARGMHSAWAELADETWQATLSIDVPAEPVWIDGDESHLQQAVENLLFNARDATFQRRHELRDAVYRDHPAGSAGRKRALREASRWRGEVALRVSARGGRAVLEVADNGVGMTAEVRERCLDSHFSTKRGKAIFAGEAAGMGLGLSFVKLVLERHGAELEFDSEPGRGTAFRIVLPAAEL